MTLNDYLALFPSASRNKPRLMALAAAVLRQAADLIPLTSMLVSGFSFAQAAGVQLDMLGESAGLPRAEAPGGADTDDESYRAYLLAKLALWTWDGTNAGAAETLERISPGRIQRDNGDGTVTVSPAGGIFCVPAGIRAIAE